VNGCTILVIHLIELVDQAQALVCQHKRTAFKRPLPSDWILMDTCCQSDGTSTLSGSVDTPVKDLLDVLKELGLGRAGVTKQQAVDITADFVFSVYILGLSTKHGECDSLLHKLVPVDAGSD